MRTGRFRWKEKHVARYAWPAGVATAGAAWYAADSLRHRREGGHGYRLRDEVDVREASFLRAAEALTGAPVSHGNDAELLINGDEIFPAYLGAIRNAEETVNLTTYAYWRGDIAIEVADALCEKAGAGVECNVILDAVGAAQMDRKLVHKMRDAGVHVCFFRPPKPYAVRRLQGAFAENWLECTGDVLAGDRYLPYVEATEDGGPMQVMRSSATVGDSNAEALVYLAVAAAKRSIELTSAYFVPRPAFTEALVEAAERGVRMRILVPGSHIDKQFVRTAGRAAYDQLIDAGIEIYEYCPTMLHAKTLTVDEIWSSVGSVNFDNRSFQLHDEVTLCAQSERFAGELHEVFEKDLEASERIEPDGWRERPITQRARENVTKYARREL